MSCEETPPERSSVEPEDMDEPNSDNVEVQISTEGTEAVSATTTAEGLKLQPGGAVELQQQALAQLQMPGLGNLVWN